MMRAELVNWKMWTRVNSEVNNLIQKLGECYNKPDSKNAARHDKNKKRHAGPNWIQSLTELGNFRWLNTI